MLILSSITEFSEVVVKHFVDSVLPFTMVDVPQGSSFIDVGTGAGFPAIPLLICRPDLKGTLCDSLNKRCVYLEKACELIGVSLKLSTRAARNSEEKKRECFDFATARASRNASAFGILYTICEGRR